MYNIILIVIIIFLVFMFTKKKPTKEIPKITPLPRISPREYTEYGYLRIDNRIIDKIKNIIVNYPFKISLTDYKINFNNRIIEIKLVFGSLEGIFTIKLDITNYLNYDQLFYDLKENKLKEINDKISTPPPTIPK